MKTTLAKRYSYNSINVFTPNLRNNELKSEHNGNDMNTKKEKKKRTSLSSEHQETEASAEARTKRNYKTITNVSRELFRFLQLCTHI